MGQITRREFLQHSGIFAASITLFGKWAFADSLVKQSSLNGYIAAPQDAKELYSRYPANLPKGPSTVFTNLKTGETRFLPGINSAHSVVAVRSSKARPRLVVIPKHAKQAIIIDPFEGRVLANFNSTKDRDFFGHGTCSEDGQFIFCSESAKDRPDGLISVRNSVDGKLVDQFPSYGQNPHEMMMLNRDKTLLVANAGPLDYDTSRDGRERTSMAFIDLKSGKLDQRLLSKTPNVKLAHFARTQSGQIFVGGVPGTNKDKTPARVMTSNGKDDLQELPIPRIVNQVLANETLSVVANDKIVAASMPFCDRVLVWDTQSLKFNCAIEVKHPTGLCIRDSALFVGADLGQLIELDIGSARSLGPRFPNALAGNQTHITPL
jgi:hypothetical protein